MNRNKIITIIISLIIILGIIITLTAGFNANIMTKEHKAIELNIGKEFKVEELKEITNAVFNGQQVEIEKVEIYGEQVLISTNDITEEQKTDLISKINEKYGTELKAEDVTIQIVPKANLKDYLTPHIVEFVVATVLVVLYACIRYKKLGFLKVGIQTVLGIVILEMLVFSLLVITRIPVGTNLVPVMFVTYVMAILGLTMMFEDKLKELKLKEESDK